MLLSDDPGVRGSLVNSLQIFGYRFVLVNPDTLGIGTNIGLVKDPARQQLKLLLFQGKEQTAADLGGGDDFVEGNAAHLPFPTQTLTK